MTEANFREVAIPAERKKRSTMDIQRASSLTINVYIHYICVYMCAYIHICICTYIQVCVCVHTHMYREGGKKEEQVKTICKMNAGYEEVH